MKYSGYPESISFCTCIQVNVVEAKQVITAEDLECGYGATNTKASSPQAHTYYTGSHQSEAAAG